MAEAVLGQIQGGERRPCAFTRRLLLLSVKCASTRAHLTPTTWQRSASQRLQALLHLQRLWTASCAATEPGGTHS